jgi:hypothetical protein
MAPVDTAAVARVLGEVGRELARPDVTPALESSPRESADAIVAVIVRGLRNPQPAIGQDADDVFTLER